MTDHGLRGSFQSDPSERTFASQSRVCHGATTITVSPSQSDLMSSPSRFTSGWIERDTHARSMHARSHAHMHTLRIKTKVQESITKGFENDLRRNKKKQGFQGIQCSNPMRHGGDLGGSDEFEAKRRALKAARDVAVGCRSAARTRSSTRASTLLKFR